MFAYNRDPFFNFFKNINQEVDQMNTSFNDPFFNRVFQRRAQQPQSQSQAQQAEPTKAITSKDDNNKAVAKPEITTDTQQLTAPAWLFPSQFTTDPFFSTSLTNFAKEVTMTPPVDVHEQEDSYNVSVSIPGVPKDKLTIDYNRETNELVIKGVIPEKTSTVTSEDDKAKKIHSERAVGKFNRTLKLPTTIDGENIKAVFKNGVLELGVPKLKGSENFHRIEISSSESSEDVDNEEKKSKLMKKPHTVSDSALT